MLQGNQAKTVNLPILGLLVFTFVHCAPPCSPKDAVSEKEIRAAVRNLGSHTPEDRFEAFYKNPEAATRILIEELRPTVRGQYITDTHPQAVWIVRALRALTGLDFRAVTTKHLGADEAHYLGLNANGTVKFFGTWMSRDRVWVAPEDAQVAIIKQWQKWFAQYGNTHNYVNNRNYDDWYF